MRLRTHDEYYDPKKLAAGRQALRDRLEAFLDPRVEGDGDGWAPVDLEDHREMREIFDQIIALKWGTDADGDLPINYATVNRNEGTLVSDVLPYSPWQRARHLEHLTPAEREREELKYRMDLLQSLSYLSSTVEHHLRVAAGTAADELGKMDEAIKRNKERDEFITLLASRTDEQHYQEDKAKAIHFSKEVFKNDSEEMVAIHDQMAKTYPDQLVAEIASIMAVMAEFNSDNEPGFEERVRKPRTDTGRAFGRFYTNEINPRANELYQAGYAIRLEARKARSAAREQS